MEPNTFTATAIILTGKAPIVVGTLALVGAGTIAYGTLSLLAALNGYTTQFNFIKPRKN